MTDTPCTLCGSPASEVRPGLALRGVTSDIKPWPSLGNVLCCTCCGHVQKRQDDKWRAATAAIYADYVMYHLSGGAEQVIFAEQGASPRTARLIQSLAPVWKLPDTGRLLDVGCGGGAFLEAFHQAQPGWSLFGHDHCEQRRAEVLAVPGVCGFSSGNLDEESLGKFDAVTLIHVLEHMTDPVSALSCLRRLLRPGGTLLVMVPNLTQGPFDLTVVDHSGHYFADTLALAVERAGFTVAAVGQDWTPKEVGLVAKALSGAPELGPDRRWRTEPGPDAAARGQAIAENALDWLTRTLEAARAAAELAHARGGTFGLFGTAIAGSWLAQGLEGHVDFFVDEDSLRWGRMHLGLPIIGPQEAPVGAELLLGFPPDLARDICTRARKLHPGLRLLLPPD